MKWMLTLVLATGAIVGYEGGQLLAGKAGWIDYVALGLGLTFVTLMYLALFTNVGEKGNDVSSTPRRK